jgi:ubiquinone/menaquinone biosynthesis C-methylase UbiE
MEPRNLAAQLRCPHGASAARVACQLNESNSGVNRACIALLGVQPGDRVLEIGPANGAFAAEVMEAAPDVSYAGLDLSADMVRAAQERNSELIAAGRALFRQGSSAQLPFDAAAFDKAFTVHTLYFWDEPDAHLREIHRVLKPGGLFCLGFGDRRFMQDLPFVPYGFALYDAADAQLLLEASGFRVLQHQALQESAHSNMGEGVDKMTNIILCGTE